MLEIKLTPPQSVTTGQYDTVVFPLGQRQRSDNLPEQLGLLIDSGEAKTKLGSVAVTHSNGQRLVTVGLGDLDELTTEFAREAGAKLVQSLNQLAAVSAVISCEDLLVGRELLAFTNGALLASYSFQLYKSKPEDPAKLAALDFATASVEQRKLAEVITVTEAQFSARDLQNSPANHLTPTHLAARATQLADEISGLSVEVGGRAEIQAAGMGAFACVAQGSVQEPQLIVLRYKPEAAAKGPVLGLVGKAVTFDTGGISLKPSPKMQEMKFDMSGGAAVLEATAAIARLKLPIELVSVIGATENMPGGRAVKPGDIVTAKNGKTIEVNNTDAEGRLVLADCLSYAVELGAERLVNFATLTGAIIVALGSTHAGLFSNDDDWAQQLQQAAAASDELVWQLPLHPEYAKSIEGQYGDLANVNEDRKAGSITAAEFLKHFVGETPWAHVDIAGTAWNLGRPYAAKGGSGFGVSMIVELAKACSE